LPNSLEGVLVRQVEPSSPLYDEGVAPGDVVTEVNGRPVTDAGAFEKAVSGTPSGSYLRLYVRRFNTRGGGEGTGFFAITRVP
jgi:serine protease Do